MKSSNEIRVGIVVAAALVLMATGYFFIRGIGLNASTYYLQLNGAANVSEGSEVRVQGVKVGQVTHVSLDEQQRPLLTFAVKKATPPIKLLETYRYSVRTSSLLGENYIDIRGPFTPAAEVYPANSVIQGQAPAGLTEASDEAAAFISDARSALKEFTKTIQAINNGVLAPQNQAKLTQALDGVVKLTQAAQQGFGKEGVRLSFGDPRSQRALNETLENSAAAARNLQNLTADAGGVLRQNKGEINRLLGSLNTAANSTAKLTNSLYAVVQDSKLRENSTLTLNAVRRTSENFEQASANFKALTSDKTTTDSLRNSIAALAQTTAALRDTAESFKVLTTDPEVQGQLRGTLATLATTAQTLQKTTENLQGATAGLNNVIGSQQVQDDLKASVSELRGTLEAGRGAAERINSLLGGRRNRKSPEEGGGVKAQRRGYAPGGFDFTYRYIGEGGAGGGMNNARNFGDITFNAELFGGPFRAGVANIGEGNDLTLQTGRFLGDNGALRYGIYRSKLGIGADYNLGKITLEGNLYDPNRHSYNAYIGYQVTPNFEILAGREKTGGVRSNAIGVRLTP